MIIIVSTMKWIRGQILWAKTCAVDARRRLRKGTVTQASLTRKCLCHYSEATHSRDVPQSHPGTAMPGRETQSPFLGRRPFLPSYGSRDLRKPAVEGRATRFHSVTADPTARRPTELCDPYGQDGKPLGSVRASSLLSTLDDGWVLEYREGSSHQEVTRGQSSDEEIRDALNFGAPDSAVPSSIRKEFNHVDFVLGSKFVSHVAAVAYNNNHYPVITLERRLLKKEKAWKVVTTVRCSTPTFNGLSYNDFHIAMLVDVEVGRPEVMVLLLGGDKN